MLLREVFALALVLALALLASRIGRWLRGEKAATDSPSPTTPTPTLTPKSSEVLAGASGDAATDASATAATDATELCADGPAPVARVLYATTTGTARRLAESLGATLRKRAAATAGRGAAWCVDVADAADYSPWDKLEREELLIVVCATWTGESQRRSASETRRRRPRGFLLKTNDYTVIFRFRDYKACGRIICDACAYDTRGAKPPQ